MNKVLISKEIPPIGIEMLKASMFSPTILESNVSLSRLNKNQLDGVVGIITMLSDTIDEHFLAQAKDLKVVSNYAVGVNNLDLHALKKRNILVGNTPDVLTEATAELTVALLLTSTRNLHAASSSLYTGSWQGFHPMEFLGPTLFNKQVSIFGFGRIGKKVGEILHYGFGNKISVIDRNSVIKNESYPFSTLNEEDFLKNADILILNAPLTNETKYWLNSSRLKLLKNNITIVNTGRGDLIIEEDLINFLNQNPNSRYATDVLSTEPIAIDHEFIKMPNVTLLPHIGSATFEARNEMSQICAKNIIMALNEGKVFKGPEIL